MYVFRRHNFARSAHLERKNVELKFRSSREEKMLGRDRTRDLNSTVLATGRHGVVDVNCIRK